MISVSSITELHRHVARHKLAGVVSLGMYSSELASSIANEFCIPTLSWHAGQLTRVSDGTEATRGRLLVVDSSLEKLQTTKCPGIKVLWNSVIPTPPPERHHVKDITADRADRKWLLIVPDSDSWFGPARGDLFAKHLRYAGIEADVVRNSPNIAERIGGYAVVWNHALCVDIASMDRLADRCPDTQVVNINHSSLSYLEYTGRLWTKYLLACQSAKQRSNVWSLSQDERCLAGITGCERIRQVSMPLWNPSPREYRDPSNPVKLVMAGRRCPIKNHLNTLVAVAMLKEQCELHLCINACDNFNESMRLMGINPIRHQMKPHADWMEFLRTEADIVLQPSITESYNVVAAEAQQTGVPVICSPTIYPGDPSAMVADPNQPQQIVDRVRQVIEHYPEYCASAIRFGVQSANSRNTDYAEFVSMLATRVTQRPAL